jgi:hypothetical protein
MRDYGKYGGADTGTGAGVKLTTPKSRSKCSEIRERGDRFRADNQRFFDVNQDRNEENKKTPKMKVAPNKLLKTKRKLSEIITYPNKYLKINCLTLNSN